MKAAAIAMFLCLGAMPALAQTANRPSPSVPPTVRPGPAPLIGLGIPIALAVGGVLVGAKFLSRKRLD